MAKITIIFVLFHLIVTNVMVVGVIGANSPASLITKASLLNQDSVIDKEGDLVPIKGISLAWQNSAEVTDQYIFAGDIVSIRLLQLEKKYEHSKIIFKI